MNIDENTINRLMALDDDSLREIIKKIASAAGADPVKAERMSADIGGIKKTISRMTPSDAERFINIAGKDKSEEILRMINRDCKD